VDVAGDQRPNCDEISVSDAYRLLGGRRKWVPHGGGKPKKTRKQRFTTPGYGESDELKREEGRGECYLLSLPCVVTRAYPRDQ